MSVRLFVLRGAPVDEVEEIRDLLTRHHIDYYETPPGNWGISSATIWLKDESQLQNAKGLIDAYQKERAIRIREEYAQLKKEGKIETIFDKIKNQPIQSITFLAIVLLVIYISIKPFMDLSR